MRGKRGQLSRFFGYNTYFKVVSLWHVSAHYRRICRFIVCPPNLPENIVDLDEDIKKNIQNLAKAKNKDIKDICVSRLCGVKPHVLRYWEQEFEQLADEEKPAEINADGEFDNKMFNRFCPATYSIKI